MTTVQLRKRMTADPAVVWERIADFHNVHTWFPATEFSEPAPGLIDTRRLTTETGAVVFEELIESSADTRTLRWRVLGDNGPIRDYVGTFVVHAAPEGGAVLEYTGTFTAPDAVRPYVEATFQAALDNLASLLG
ncbi:SRPBCC family protein [Amycolatopsis sp. DSM 110486]|uniref:SRPBCC family protein n=1 Tax=Amycolatopsis sp. DSM 110486 TaxID=2865832 RepID=UPI001C69FABE|nr:SRPBCC family protein [Amycolatopsis sp. DSM 110486]QYN23259.1 SRPBCC family protein [Amycolatopsis sp. DSM 110486]